MTRRQLALALLGLLAFVAANAAPATAQAQGTNRPAKYVRFRVQNTTSYGVVEGDENRVRVIEGNLFGANWKTTEKTYALSEVKLLPPARPNAKVLAVGRNYKSHLGTIEPSPHPEIFFKLSTCLVPQGANIVIPKGAEDVHYEGELVVVMARRAKNVAPEKAADYVLGVTCGNDVSERIWQKADLQWWRAKGSDTFGPCGPWIAAGLDYNNLKLRTRVNGEVKQEASTADLIHNVATTVSWISHHVTLEPGDLIFTGTPGTTSALKPGDVVEVEIEGIGTLRNKVVAAKP